MYDSLQFKGSERALRPKNMALVLSLLEKRLAVSVSLTQHTTLLFGIGFTQYNAIVDTQNLFRGKDVVTITLHQ
jgi:hypothetical protein